MASIITQYSETVDFPVGEIWAILAAFGSEKLWMPDCYKSSLEGFGKGSTRTLHFGEFQEFAIRERLEHVDAEAHEIRFRVFGDDPKGLESYGTVVLDALEDKKTKITWTGESSIDPSLAGNLKERLDKMYQGFVHAIVTLLK